MLSLMNLRLLTLALTLMMSGQALAQSEPDGLIPAPEPPPIPERVRSGEALDPDITIIQRERETIIEYRQNGQLRAVKVVPKNKDFPPYYLVDGDGDGRLDKRTRELTPDFFINNWVLFSW